MLVRLRDLVFGDNPPAGMDLAVIGHWAMIARKTAEPCDPPIVVGEACPTCGVQRVTDGRHRVVGWLAGGRTHIETGDS